MKDINRSEIKFLKFFVYTMGFVLIFATLFLTYVIYKKSFETTITYTEPKSKCNNVNLKVGGRIHNITFEGGHLQVTYKDENGGFKVAIYDYCNGNIINEIAITEYNDHKNSEELQQQKHEDIELDEKNILS